MIRLKHGEELPYEKIIKQIENQFPGSNELNYEFERDENNIKKN
ncbi:MAG: hypothetical protein ACFFAS_01700 [Promethearchaeota archaeon]